MYESKKSEMYDMADVPTYEEVTPYRRLAGAKHRLVVLVGRRKDWKVSLNAVIEFQYQYFTQPILFKLEQNLSKRA